MKTKQIFKIILAVIVGEIALIIFATGAQEVFFDGIQYTTSSRFDLIVGGILTSIAAVLAGVVARLVSKSYYRIIPIALSIIITAEMTYLITSGKTGDPAWFDIMGGGSLILGVWIGYNYKMVLTYLNIKKFHKKKLQES